ncbi:sensor domain-containing diguanylate cyclase [Cupriavidus basilensis]|uniref:diguanylate cyclase n=1 Tax=Cupriavidus basilensis TaxID=68895 RepID=A0ABT6AJE1_9BURK|nr:sensor domain-containing diguanylate cyclase [Cupriavidus basilensis]MDF3832569.1 sensor domain-containing diguanylate cyclase [Cupriavidus basilensis]
MGLGGLILLLALGSVLLTMANTLYSSYRVQRDLLIRNTLEANRVYAAKLAESTETHLDSTMQQLAYSARVLASNMDVPARLAEEADRLRLQTRSLNSVAIVRRDGTLVAVSPATLRVAGTSVKTDWGHALLTTRTPAISEPFISSTGRLIIFISHPIIDAEGRLLGYLGGTIYLNAKNMLHTILDRHYYRDSSYVYVVDRKGTIIFHPDNTHVGKSIIKNAVVRAVTGGEAGSQDVQTLYGVDMLAGYAPVKSTGWGIVVQKSTETTLANLNHLALVTFGNSIPFLLLSLVFIWWFSRLISRPLGQLAENARMVATPDGMGKIEKILCWYLEADRLKKALLRGMSLTSSELDKLNQQTITDALTGLRNRRGLANALDLYRQAGQSFAAITLDVDHFKAINDRYGHDVGDQVLKHIAGLMRAGSRGGDMASRSGGEEFVILLPGSSQENAFHIAERLREAVERTPNPTGGVITISLGVAHFPSSAEAVGEVLKQSDIALYQAKRSGRNKTVSYRKEPAGAVAPH